MKLMEKLQVKTNYIPKLIIFAMDGLFLFLYEDYIWANKNWYQK